MPEFTTEALVRDTFHLHDTVQTPPTLLERAIADAHTVLLRHLEPAYDSEPAPDGLVLGETLLAGAHLFNALAAEEAFKQKQVALGTQRIDAGARFKALEAVADDAATRAWDALEPYLREIPSQSVLTATDTTPVLGEDAS
ncbi:MAG: hypothetical protein K8F31_07585 [Roseovarius sp.]|nr:hypothetical protein [Roseovarius sp.]